MMLEAHTERPESEVVQNKNVQLAALHQSSPGKQSPSKPKQNKRATETGCGVVPDPYTHTNHTTPRLACLLLQNSCWTSVVNIDRQVDRQWLIFVCLTTHYKDCSRQLSALLTTANILGM